MKKIVCNLATRIVGEVDLTAKELMEINFKQKAWEASQDVLATTEYQRQRAAAYPPITDYLDGVVKGDTAQVQTYIDACLAVKLKYPKPE